MTQEEAIKVLNQVRQWTDYPKEAFTMAIDALSQPSLPSDLDEVKLNTDDMNDSGYKALAEYYFNRGKRVGAEWMAGQGASFKVNVEEVPKGHWYAGLHLGGCAEEEENALKSINAKDGEEVIVQIRKKQ